MSDDPIPRKYAWILPGTFVLWTIFLLDRYFSLPADPRALLGSAFTWTGGGSFEGVGFFLGLGGILLGSAAILWVTLQLGRVLGDRLGLRIEDAWLTLCAEFSLGMVLLSTLWLGLGLVRLWYDPLIHTVLLLLFLLSLWRVRAPWERPLFPWPRDLVLSGLLGLSLLYLLFSILHGFLPETHPDGLVYHLGTLSYWWFHHGMTDLPSQPMGGFPYAGELYFLTGYWVGGSEVVKVLNVAVLGLVALAAASWAGEKAGPDAKWLVFGMISTLPLLHLVSWTSQVEVLQCLFLVLFLYGMEKLAGVGTGKARWAFLVGLWAAMALSIKTTSVFGIAAGAIACLVTAKDRGALIRPRNWGWAAVLFGVLAGTWFLKDWVYTGDPFYPWWMEHFTGRHMSPEGYRFMLQEAGSGAAGSWWSLPWDILMSRPALFNFAGPLLMVLLPFAIYYFCVRDRILFLALSALALWALGLSTTGILKFQLPAMVLTLMLCGILFRRDGKGPGPRWAAAAAFLSGLFCFPYLAGMSGHYYSGAGLWTGRETPSAYRARVVQNPYEDLCRYTDKFLPPDARLLIVGDARGLYYSRDFYADTGYDIAYLAGLARRGLDAEGIRGEVRKMGFTHLVVNAAQGITAASMFLAYPLDKEQWRALDDYFRRALEPLFSDGYGFIYRVRPGPLGKPDAAKVDPVLFFSRPAVGFIAAFQRGDRKGMADAQREIHGLFPFPGEWDADGLFLRENLGR